ncbi:hypothetical protein ACSBR2_037764 [Camellia fascicularis]
MASSRGSLTFFPDLNESTIEMTDSDSLEPQPHAPPPSSVFSFPAMSIEQIMAAQSDIEANSYMLRSCVETVTAISNLSRPLQNKTFDATFAARFGVSLRNQFDGRQGVISFESSANAKIYMRRLKVTPTSSKIINLFRIPSFIRGIDTPSFISVGKV